MLKDRVIFLTHNLDASYTEFLIAHYRLSDLIREYAKSKERKQLIAPLFYQKVEFSFPVSDINGIKAYTDFDCTNLYMVLWNDGKRQSKIEIKKQTQSFIVISKIP